MSAEAGDFSALAARFRGLGSADRRAVLARFNASERQAFERRLRADEHERHRKQLEERRADRQFAAYSSTLAAKVERAVRGTAVDEDHLTADCAAAIVRAHKVAEKAPERSPLDTILVRLGLGSLAVPNGSRP